MVNGELFLGRRPLLCKHHAKLYSTRISALTSPCKDSRAKSLLGVDDMAGTMTGSRDIIMLRTCDAARKVV